MSAVPETAERYVQALVEQGVDCLFLNPGTDTFPIQEALAKLEAEGCRVPRTVLCPFEVVARRAGNGYFAATGRPQAVLVHVDVGTQNLGGQLHNAQRGRAAVFVSAGRSPYTSDLGVRGGRDTYIHWLQEQLDQHGVVRNYAKWDYELRRPDQIGEAIARAFQIAASDPPGPVYLPLPRETLAETIDAARVRSFPESRYGPVAAGGCDPETARAIAEQLLSAENPIAITSYLGRRPESARLLGIRGIGPVTVGVVMAIAGDPWRFRRHGDFSAYVGLVPREDQSGEHDPQLGITKAGDRLPRKVLTECAQRWLGKQGMDCALRRWALALAGDGKNKIRKRKAVIALARKFAELLLLLWRSGADYDPWHGVTPPDAEAAA